MALEPLIGGAIGALLDRADRAPALVVELNAFFVHRKVGEMKNETSERNARARPVLQRAACKLSRQSPQFTPRLRGIGGWLSTAGGPAT